MVALHRRSRKALAPTLSVALIVSALAFLGASSSSASTASMILVNTTTDSAVDYGACGDSRTRIPPDTVSLREAVCLANNLGGEVVIRMFSGTFKLTNGRLLIGRNSGQNVTLRGAGAASTIIDADGNSGVLSFGDGYGGGLSGTVSGLTIRGGVDDQYGGAGIIAGSANAGTRDSLTIEDSVITANKANSVTPNITNRPGGGVQFIGGALTIRNSTISDNSSGSSPGAGVAYSAQGVASGESLTISNTTFSGNTMTNTNGTAVTNGGALDVRGMQATAMSVTDSKFIDNEVTASTGGALGAAIRQQSGNLTVTRSDFSGNVVSGGTAPAGGAIEVTTGTATLHYNRFVGNSAAAGSALHVGTDAGTVNASHNWFGCNTGPGATGCDSVSAVAPATVTTTPRLALSISQSELRDLGADSTITASLTTDSAGGAVLPANLTAFDNKQVTMSGVFVGGRFWDGTFTYRSITQSFLNGQSSTTYLALGDIGTYAINAKFDNALASGQLVVNSRPVVTKNPAATTVLVGATASFNATASAYPASTVQWQRSTDGGDSFSDINGATGATYSFTATAADNGYRYRAVFSNAFTIGTEAFEGLATSTAATLTVQEPSAFTSAGIATFEANTSDSFTITTSGLPTVTAISMTGSLPGGLTFTDNGGGTATLAGKPDIGSGGSYPINLTSVNGVSPAGSQAMLIHVNEAPDVTTSPAGQSANAGTSVTFSAAASGYPAPTVQWQQSIDDGETFSDIADETGSSYTLSAALGDDGNRYRAVFTNALGSATTSAATLHVGIAPAFTSTNVATFVAGAAGTFAVAVSGVPNATLSRTGTFPAWLTLTDNGNGTGTLTGTPPVGSGGSYSFTLKAANGFNPSASQTFTLSVDESPTIGSDDHTDFTVGTAGTFTVTTTGGFPTATTISKTGDLPTGVSLVDNGDGTATLAGTPAAGTIGSYPITISAEATGGLATSRTQSFTLTVLGPPAISSDDHTTITVGAAGSFMVTTVAGNPADSDISQTGDLPPGVTFTDNGDGTATLAGTPAADSGGSYPLMITASNGIGPDPSQSFTLTVNQPPAITSANHATFAKGTAAAFTVTTSPGMPSARTLSAPPADLPPGMTFTDSTDGTATFGGTPTAAGVYPFTITASNGVTPDATQTFTATVTEAPAITSADHTTFAAGAADSFTVRTTPGTPTSTTLSTTSSLPVGVTFTDNEDGTATIAGTPDAGTGGVYSIIIDASNTADHSTQIFVLTVSEVPAITSADHATFTVGTGATATITTTAGYPNTTTLSQTGNLPDGVTFTDTGNGTATIAGTPEASSGGSYALTITATNSAGHSDQPFTLTINEPPVFSSLDHATFTVGAAGSFTVGTGDGYPKPPALTMTGALPDDVTFVDNEDGTATIAGTPETGAGGSYPITITADNGAAADTSQSFTLTINEAPSVTTSTDPSFTVGTAGTFAVTSMGYPKPSLQISLGTLPTDITFVDNHDGTATLAGTPAAGTAGSYQLTLIASNDVDSSERILTLTVGRVAQAITLTSTPPTAPLVGDSYTPTAVADSGGTVSFSIDAATTNSACSLSGATVSFDHAGSCVINANQGGDGTYLPAPQVQQTITAGRVATMVDVVTATSPTVFGQPTRGTATVGAGGSSVAGTVQFAVDGHDLGLPVAVSAGSAISPVLTDGVGEPLAPGSHVITATFTPDNGTVYAGSSSTVTQVVNQAATTMAIAVQATSLTATVFAVAPGAGTPTGSVTFSVAGMSVGTATLVGGVATVNHTVAAGTAQQVSAAYSGDVAFTGSSGSTTRDDPAITARVSSAHAKTRYGWYRSAVTVTFTCATNGAPLTVPCPAPVLLTKAGAGQSVTRTIAATDGGAKTAVVRGINIDTVRPSVRVSGVKNGGVYNGTAPKARCVAKDALSGVASCKVTKHKSGTTTTYKVTATDKAGNLSSVTGRYRTNLLSLQGVTFTKGAFNVRRGRTYTLVMYASKRPIYYNAEVAPRKPHVRGMEMRKAGHNRYALGVSMTGLRGRTYWNLGVKIGKTMHIVRVRVR